METIPIPDFALLMLAGAEAMAFGEAAFPGLAPCPAEAVAARLAARESALVDVTAMGAEDRRTLTSLARAHHARTVPFLAGPDPLGGAGLADARTVSPADAPRIRRVPLPVDRRALRGPFDIVGDVHGCMEELTALLRALGWRVEDARAFHPEGRIAIFAGDLTDRGPRNLDVLHLVSAMVREGTALCVTGNHELRLHRWLSSARAPLLHGLRVTAAEFDAAPPQVRLAMRAFIGGLPSHLWLDGGALVVAHAGLTEAMHGRDTDAVRRMAASGPPDWPTGYRGAARVVHGHTPTRAPRWRGHALCLDAGCVYGGALAALRWPEREIVAVPATRAWAAPARPFLP